MASNDQVNVSVTASIKGLTDGLASATSVIRKSTEEISGMFGGLSKAIENIKAPFIALTAIVGGGKLFHEAVTAAGKWASESVKLAKAVGGTTEQASVLKVALHGLGIDTETYTGATMFLSRQVVKGVDGFKKLGIEIRDSQGHLRPMNDIMRDSLDKLNGLKAGVDRNAAGVALFGSGWAETSKLLRLNKERMEEARKEAEELHLIVGPEGAKRARAYQEATRKIGLVMESLQIQIGNAVMPTLLLLGKWLGEAGPTLAKVMEYAIKGIVHVFLELKVIVEVVVLAVIGWLTQLWDILKSVGTALWQIMRGDFEGAWKTLKGGWKEFQRDGETAISMIGEKWDGFAADAKTNMFGKADSGKGSTKVEQGGANYEPEDSENTVKKWKAQLEQIRAAAEETYSWTLQRERDFWASKLALAAKGTDAYNQVFAEIAKVNREIRKKDLEEELAGQREAEQTMAGRKQAEEDALRRAAKLGQVTREQEIQGLIALEQEKLEIKKRYLQTMLTLEGLDPQKRAEIRQQLLAADKEYAKKRGDLETDLALEQRANAPKFVEPFVQGFSSGIQRIIEGTLSFKDAIKGIFGMLRQALAQAISGMVADWIAGLGRKLAAFISMKAAELATGQATDVASTTSSVAASTTKATAAAVEGGIKAGASAAEVPGIGWLIALPVAGAVVGGLLAMMSGISAAGGYDIPSGVNPVVQTHAREMILPAKYADVIRQMAEGGDDGSGGGSRQRPVQVVVQGVIDGGHLIRTLNSSEGQAAILRAVNEALRNGRTK